ncbi:ABC transporter permease [bacterium]|nr:ABC transporter permease [bacterium]
MEKKVYIPEGVVKRGIRIYFNMTKELIEARELILRLFIRDFLAKYKQALLGIAWAIIMPVVVIGAFIFMNRSGILNIGDVKVPYPVFAILGLTIWQLFATGLTNTTNSIINAGSMVIKINFPRETLVISSMAHAFFDFLVRIVIVAIVLAFYKVVPSWKTVFFPFTLIPLLLLTVGIGFILSLLNCIARDTTNVVSLITTFLLFITPVLYQVPKSGIFAAFNRYNILAPLINAPREIVLYGKISDVKSFLISSFISLFLFLFFWRIFHLAEHKMAEIV